MLAEKQLKPELQSGKIFNLTETNINNVKIQPSSIDLTVKFIHIPGKKNTKKSHTIEPGETVILELNEVFSLSNEISGIVFPKNTLSKNGIIMTNPGHVDPGYKGILTLYLVNMSKENFNLREKDAVARLLLFKTSSPTNGYQGPSPIQVDQSQLERMGKDFAGLDTRIPVAIGKVLSKWSVGLFVLVALMLSIVGLAVPVAFTITSSYLDNTKDLKQNIKDQEQKIEKLNKEIIILNSREPKPSATISKKAVN
ncbi:TPA: hypothetical protein U2I11_004658 [Citrobacter koseri]|jgi:deoxycytidine triphosphate deaminase|uniref:Uncharacterized protein n=4 Tax=Enterobacteriaceae TaxID=543 RepID=A0A753SJW2_SALER|nr:MULTISPECIES: hypothetical protein [Enterobacteriaceae]EAM8930579.1 hypothetical protein [Salmonella enterica]EBR9057175.1 hypothetical protein [Salmonella enterica subsp. enterica serovar Koketime]OFV14478.1 hypothetical protein HMPREF3126_08470 [Salmonella sp. HMSC13B08]HBM3227768.1 hypothetical protein [Klebsiella oxytoca]HCM9330095.1 hypothetical protein [Enterobacter hormaechei subsp. steigerwaltii]